MGELMERELLELLVSNISSGINCQLFIESIIEIVTKYRNLGDYITDVTYSPIRKKINGEAGAAEYNPLEKKINIDLEAVESIIKENELTGSFALDRGKKIALRIQIMQYVLHELEHANQRRIVISEDTLESHILRLSEFSLNNYEKRAYFKMDDEKQGIKYIRKLKAIKEKNYEENYKHCPKERLAEIKSHQEIVQVLSCMSEYTSNLIDYEKINIFRSMYNGYEDVFSPTIYYIEENGTPEVLNEFDWYTKKNDKTLELCKKKYSFDDRLKYGLPLDKKENKYCKKYLKKNSKYV
jgi:hypothetical protein